jgi:hypothetical protein
MVLMLVKLVTVFLVVANGVTCVSFFYHKNTCICYVLTESHNTLSVDSVVSKHTTTWSKYISLWVMSMKYGKQDRT